MYAVKLEFRFLLITGDFRAFVPKYGSIYMLTRLVACKFSALRLCSPLRLSRVFEILSAGTEERTWRNRDGSVLKLNSYYSSLHFTLVMMEHGECVLEVFARDEIL